MPKQPGFPNLTAVLLAGGASTRMGQPKALLDYQGRPLWHFQADKLLELQPKELLISAPPSLQLEEGPWKIIHDLQPNLGPLGGLDAALDAMTTDYLVVLAVDMPAMAPHFLQFLASPVRTKGLVPQLDGFYHGLVAFYPAKVGPLVKQVFSSEDRSVQHLVKRALADGLVEIHLVNEVERSFFRNLNRPSDL